MPPFYPSMNPYYGGEASQTLPLQPAQAVLITLTPTDSNDQRHITLYANRPVTVGRSSKSETKNLLPSNENALFDCPVVSRKHAELEFKPNPWADVEKQVTLTDKASMHGTSVNGTKLQKDVPFTLKTGDKIKFGDKVARADDTHEGIIVSLRILNSTSQGKRPITIVKPTSGFQVPSESEYDSDDADSNYSHADDQPSSAHTTPEQDKTAVGSQKSPIDVDNNKPTGSLREIIDLDPPASAQRPVFRLQPRPSNMPTSVVPDSLDPFVLNPLPSLSGQPVNAAFQPHTSQTGADADSESVMHHNTGLMSFLNAKVKEPKGVFSTAPPRTVEHSLPSDVDSEDENAMDMFASEDEDDEDDDEQLSASDASDLVDDDSVSEHSEEGPEEQSSKRQLSPELGTLGQDTNKAPVAAPVKERYDPVRASQLEKSFNLMPQDPPTSNFTILPQEPKRSRPYEPYSTAADHFWDGPADHDYSSRWDVGFDGSAARPVDSVPNYGFFEAAYPFGAPVPSFNAYTPQIPPPINSASARAPAEAPASTSFHIQSSDKKSSLAQDKEEIVHANKMSIMQLVEDRKQEIEQRLAAPRITNSTSSSDPTSNNKRKADEISADDDEAMIADAEPKELMVRLPVGKASTMSSKPKKTVPARAVKKARFQKAATELTKYAVGMALGGVGTIAFLCSPLAERMLA